MSLKGLSHTDYQHNSNNSNHDKIQKHDLKIRKCQSIILEQEQDENMKSEQQNYDIGLQKNTQFLCFRCANNIQTRSQCSQCNGQGHIFPDNPLITLVNNLINFKFSVSNQSQNSQSTSNNKSTKTIDSDWLYLLQSSSPLSLSYSVYNKQKKGQNLRSQQFNSKNYSDYYQCLNNVPFPITIKQQSYVELDDKDKKCSVCHYQFDNIKFKCSECENFNVCQACYQNKIISHRHQLNRIQSLSSKRTSNIEFDPQLERNDTSLQKLRHYDNVDENGEENDYVGLNLKVFKCDQNVGEEEQKQIDKHQVDDGVGNSFFDQLQTVEVKDYYEEEECQGRIKYCQNCGQQIGECYWSCEKCRQQKNEQYDVCKNCYDHQSYTHDQRHQLVLSFLSKENSQQIKQEDNRPSFFRTPEKPQQTDNIHINIIQPLQSKSQPDIHKNIFQCFSKQQFNNTSPKQTKLHPCENNSEIVHLPSLDFSESIAPQMFASFNSIQDLNNKLQQATHNKQYNKQNMLKQTFNQSKLFLDENIDLSLSQSSNKPSLKLRKSNLNVNVNLNSNNSNFKNSMNIPRNDSTTTLGRLLLLQNSQFSPNLHHFDFYDDYQSNQENQNTDFLFFDYKCDICSCQPIKNIKFKCLECEDYDLCQNCYENKRQLHQHEKFKKEDGKEKEMKKKIQKQKYVKKIIEEQKSRIINHSPMKKSVRFIK